MSITPLHVFNNYDRVKFVSTSNVKIGQEIREESSSRKRILFLQISSARTEAQQLRDENESLAAQVTASMERPATEGRENGDVTYAETKHIDTNSDKYVIQSQRPLSTHLAHVVVFQNVSFRLILYCHYVHIVLQI